MHARSLVFAAVVLTTTGGASAQALPDGSKIYARCAACHTATGVGVPGAFPPLQSDFRMLAAQPKGRRYLALAVIEGLSGPIMVQGKSYRGFMPAQSLDDPSAAAVLNYVGTTVSKSGPAFKVFTAAEIASARASGAKMSAAEVAKLHEDAGGR